MEVEHFLGMHQLFFPLLISEFKLVHNQLLFIKFKQIVENPHQVVTFRSAPGRLADERFLLEVNLL